MTLSTEAFFTLASSEPGPRTGLAKDRQIQVAALKAPSGQMEGLETQSWAWALVEASTLGRHTDGSPWALTTLQGLA